MSIRLQDIVIVDAVRTAIGTFPNGSLTSIPADELAAITIKGLLQRTGVDKDLIDNVNMGCVVQANHPLNIARVALLKAGLDVSKPGFTINTACSSGMVAIQYAANQIMLGDAEIVIAGGTENMTSLPYLLPRSFPKMGNLTLHDMIPGSLQCPINHYHMGGTAGNIAKKYGIGRAEQDEFAYNSHRKARTAIKEGKFADEIVPVEIPQRRGDPIVFDTDEHPRDTSLEIMAKLRPAFPEDKTQTITAGNASGINDGASALLLMTETKAKELGLKPMARLISYGNAGVDPAFMGMGPAASSPIALEKAGMSIDDIDVFELNEAFAAQALGVLKEFAMPMEKLNKRGGAIALGHPVGCSGARIVVTLLYIMRDEKAKYGLATLCVGGGMGGTMIVENLLG